MNAVLLALGLIVLGTDFVLDISSSCLMVASIIKGKCISPALFVPLAFYFFGGAILIHADYGGIGVIGGLTGFGAHIVLQLVVPFITEFLCRHG